MVNSNYIDLILKRVQIFQNFATQNSWRCRTRLHFRFIGSQIYLNFLCIFLLLTITVSFQEFSKILSKSYLNFLTCLFSLWFCFLWPTLYFLFSKSTLSITHSLYFSGRFNTVNFLKLSVFWEPSIAFPNKDFDLDSWIVLLPSFYKINQEFTSLWEYLVLICSIYEIRFRL